ncbi:hypothetical protein Tco_0619977 [Tanacetum coccineum]
MESWSECVVEGYSLWNLRCRCGPCGEDIQSNLIHSSRKDLFFVCRMQHGAIPTISFNLINVEVSGFLYLEKRDECVEFGYVECDCHFEGEIESTFPCELIGKWEVIGCETSER